MNSRFISDILPVRNYSRNSKGVVARDTEERKDVKLCSPVPPLLRLYYTMKLQACVSVSSRNISEARQQEDCVSLRVPGFPVSRLRHRPPRFSTVRNQSPRKGEKLSCYLDYLYCPFHGISKFEKGLPSQRIESPRSIFHFVYFYLLMWKLAGIIARGV